MDLARWMWLHLHAARIPHSGAGTEAEGLDTSGYTVKHKQVAMSATQVQSRSCHTGAHMMASALAAPRACARLKPRRFLCMLPRHLRAFGSVSPSAPYTDSAHVCRAALSISLTVALLLPPFCSSQHLLALTSTRCPFSRWVRRDECASSSARAGRNCGSSKCSQSGELTGSSSTA